MTNTKEDESIECTRLLKSSGSGKKQFQSDRSGEKFDNVVEEKETSIWVKHLTMTKYMTPLIFCMMVPSLSEQILVRSLTSATNEENCADVLASFGLAFYTMSLLNNNSIELKHVGLVLVSNTTDHRKMAKFSAGVGAGFTVLFTTFCVTQASFWFIKDVHRQSEKIAELTTSALLYMAIIPLIEALASYHEGCMMRQKLTGYLAISRAVDVGMQVLCVLLLIFTPAIKAGIHPIFVPIISLYMGNLSRMVLDIVFWYKLVRPLLTSLKDSEKGETTICKALVFWAPVAAVRTVLRSRSVLVNLMVSRKLSLSDGPEAAAKAIAVLSATTPLVQILYKHLAELRSVVPVFQSGFCGHKYTLQVIGQFTCLMTVATYLVVVVLIVIPQSAFFLLHTVLGLSEELAQMGLMPLIIFSFSTFPVAVLNFCSGILIRKRKTKYLIPSVILTLLGTIASLFALQNARLSGASYGQLCCVLCFTYEAIFLAVTVAIIYIRKPNDTTTT